MSVAPMRKVEVVGYRPVLDEVIEQLQHLGVLQIDAMPEAAPVRMLAPDDERVRRLDEYAADARFARDFLGRYHTPGQPFAAFVTEKFHVDASRFESMDLEGEVLPLYLECEGLSEGIASAQHERDRLKDLVRDLEPWLGVRLQIGQWKGTEHTVIMTGTVPAADGEHVRALLREATPLFTAQEYGGAGLRQAWIAFAHTSVAELVRGVLAGTSFREVSFDGLQDYPAEESARAAARIDQLEERLVELHAEAQRLAAERYGDAVALAEAIDSARHAVGVRELVGHTERAFVVTGWIRASNTAGLVAALEPWGSDLDVSFLEPTEEDAPPVELDNPRWLKPFEVLTDLYGRPAYRELDPTPLLAPFFLLFFAICISDVGYGAMLAVGAWLIKKKLDVTWGVRRFMDLLMYGGVAAMVVGVAFRSYFALDAAMLPGFLRYKPLLDPLNELQTFLVFTIVLGVTQVFFGVGVSAYDSFRRGDPGAAIFEQLSTIFLFAMVAVAVVGGAAGRPAVTSWALVIGILGTMLMQGRSLEAALGEPGLPLWDRAVGWLWLAAMAAAIFVMATISVPTALEIIAGASVLALVSKTGRRSVVSLLGGAYAVYGMSAFLGDILSYTRLAALGLSGALVGMVFNILAGLVWGPVAQLWSGGGFGILGAVVVAVLAAAVFVVGHVFNVVINLLGAFVHPARLQFVEFFSKFYEGGGRPLNPFKHVTRSVVLHAGPGRQEGGTRT